MRENNIVRSIDVNNTASPLMEISRTFLGVRYLKQFGHRGPEYYTMFLQQGWLAQFTDGSTEETWESLPIIEEEKK